MFKLKRMLIIIISIVCSYFFNICTYAEEYDYGTDELYNAVPEHVKEYLDDNGITADGEGISELTIEEVFKTITDIIFSSLKQPAAMFTSLLAVIILSAVLGGISSVKDNTSVSHVYSVVAALTSTIIISSYLINATDNVDNAVSSASGFMLTYIPVLAGVIAIGGQASTAAVFSSVMMISTQVLTQIMANILFPMTSCLLGISAAGGINSDLKIDRLGEGVKKAIVWGMGLIMTIFIGFLTLQTNITASADSISLRAARFAVSTSVPFIGGAVSDALATVKTSVELLKSGVGSFGIIIGFCVLFPMFVQVLCYRFFLFCAGVISDIFGTDEAGRMIKCGENVLSIIISMIICLFLFITISTALMMIICRR